MSLYLETYLWSSWPKSGHGLYISTVHANVALTPSASTTTNTIECPLCLGAGELSRAEILDRLGAKDFARVAQLSAEEAFRLLMQNHAQEHQNGWARFEVELAKRTSEIREHHKDELRSAQSAKSDLTRKVEDCLREVAQLGERNQQLEGEMSKAVRRGKLEEVSFEDEVRTWPGMCVSEKLARNGDYLLAFRDPSGTEVEPRILVDNKDKASITEPDIKKLIRDSKERNVAIGIIVAKDETQLRQLDRDCRWSQQDGVWLLRTTRVWLRRDLDVLRPLLERMRTEGADFLQKNSALAEEVRRTLVDLDQIEKELTKAAKAVDAAAGLTTKYRSRLQGLCDSTTAKKNVSVQQDACGLSQTA
jgi:predicted nuclease with TOPRIM domain